MMHPNRFRYLKAPTTEQIDTVVKKAGVSEAQFERFHKMYEGAIKYARMNHRPMPAKHWHLFFGDTEMPGVRVGVKATPKTSNKRTKVKTTSSLSKIV